VQEDANFVPIEVAVVVAFAWGGAGAVCGAEGGEVEVGEAGEGEAEEGAGENEVKDEVVGFCEAEGVVDFAGKGGLLGCGCWFDHVELRICDVFCGKSTGEIG